MYKRGVERYYLRLPLQPSIVFFTYPGDSVKLSRTVFAYGVKGRKYVSTIEMPDQIKVNFMSTQIVQLGYSLLLF